MRREELLEDTIIFIPQKEKQNQRLDSGVQTAFFQSKSWNVKTKFIFPHFNFVNLIIKIIYTYKYG